MAAAKGSLMGTMALLHTNARAKDDPLPVKNFSNHDGSVLFSSVHMVTNEGGSVVLHCNVRSGQSDLC